MSRSVLASFTLMLACQFAIAEDRAASKDPQTKQREVQLHDLVVVLVGRCKAADDGAVYQHKDASPVERIAASVVGIRPDGNLLIEGRSSVQQDDGTWDRSLAGEVARKSIGADRTVRSQDVAKLRISLRKNNTARDDMVPPDIAPHPVRQVAAQSPALPKVAVLREKLTELAKLQEEIRQLRAETGSQPQILVRVEMLEVSLTKMRKMGFELPGISPGYLSGADVSRMLSKTKTGEPGPYTQPNAKSNSNDASSLIEWLTDNKLGKVMAEPTIMVADGQPASFNVGGEIPMPARDNSKAVEYKPFGTQIDLLATSLGHDRLRLELKVSVSELDSGRSIQINGTQYPAIHVQQVDTGIESSFGQPTVLTGMIQKRIEAYKTEAGIHESANEICTMLVVTPERVDSPASAQKPTPEQIRK